MSSRIDVIVPIFADNVLGKSFTATGQNPGVGGTQYVSIVLVLLLARRFPDIQLTLVNQIEISLPDSPTNVRVKLAPDLNEFLRNFEQIGSNTVIILPAVMVRSVELILIKKFQKRLVAWVHHPFQCEPLLLKMRFAAHVHVGSYQYFSNASFYRNNWYINSPFVLPDNIPGRVAPDVDSKIRIIYLGALIEVKGFGHLARQWSSIKNALSEVELHVIGSSSTYGKSAEHEFIPCDSNFAEEILKYIPLDDIEAKRVVFHGNLGQEKFRIMRSAHLAILNPTGASEAFPASPLECMACGLPVIASDDYGMSDSMKFFPELILRSPDEIPARLQFLMSDRRRYEELSARSVAVATWFDSQTDVILARWRRLIDLVVKEQGMSISDYPPLGPQYGSLYRLKIRQIRAWLVAFKRSEFNFLNVSKEE